jgi:hypothetical protein
VPPEGVVNALRALHTALVPGGLVIDTQPLSPHPPIEGDGGILGTLDMSEWAELIDEIDGRTDEAIAEGLFAIEHESRFTVADEYDDGEDCLSYVRNWMGTRIDPDVERRVAAERGHIRLPQEVRLRLLRRLNPRSTASPGSPTSSGHRRRRG